MLRIKLSTKKPVVAYLSPGSEASGLQRLIFLKYCNVPKWESRFNLGLNTAENTDCIKKHFK